jgi:hypothetical protein
VNHPKFHTLQQWVGLGDRLQPQVGRVDRLQPQIGLVDLGQWLKLPTTFVLLVGYLF